jgi:peptide/nickel transport system substrate-binding protein
MGSFSRRDALGTIAAGMATFPTLLGDSAALAKGSPKYGGHLRVGLPFELTSLDPVLGRGGGDGYYFHQIFDQLVDSDQSLTPRPSTSLAESWEVSTNPHSITFKLRKNVSFQDGTPFNAAAVKANIDRLLNPETKATPRAAFSRITSVDVIDDSTVRFNLSAPWGGGIGLLSDRGGAMSSPTAIAKLGADYGFNPVGTGPFKVAEVVSGSFVRIVRNENYWGKDAAGNKLPYLDEITLKLIKDQSVLTSALRSGEIDLAYLPAREVDTFSRDDKFQIETLKGGAIASVLAFNIQKSPVDNVHLRRAIIHGINAADINKAVYFDKAMVADAGMWPVNTWVYQPSAARPTFSLDKARQELAAGGKPGGFEVSMVTWNSPELRQTTQILKAMLSRVGIIVNIDVLNDGPATEQFFQAKAYPIYLTSWSRYPEPDWVASLNYKSDGYYNAGKASRPDVDQLVAEGASIYDQEQRKKIYHKINDIVLGEAWMMPLLYTITYAAAPRYVQNMDTLIGWDGKISLRSIYLDKA